MGKILLHLILMIWIAQTIQSVEAKEESTVFSKTTASTQINATAKDNEPAAAGKVELSLPLPGENSTNGLEMNRDDPPTTAPPPPGPGPTTKPAEEDGGGGGMTIIILVILVLAFGGLVGGYFGYKYMKKRQAAAGETTTAS